MFSAWIETGILPTTRYTTASPLPADHLRPGHDQNKHTYEPASTVSLSNSKPRLFVWRAPLKTPEATLRHDLSDDPNPRDGIEIDSPSPKQRTLGDRLGGCSFSYRAAVSTGVAARSLVIPRRIRVLAVPRGIPFGNADLLGGLAVEEGEHARRGAARVVGVRWPRADGSRRRRRRPARREPSPAGRAPGRSAGRD